MAKYVHNDVFVLAANHIADNGNKVVLCSAQPTTYAEANATYKLAIGTMTLGDGNDHYEVVDSAAGVDLVITPAPGIVASGDDDSTHIAILDSVNEKLLLVTTMTTLAVTTGMTLNIAEFKLTFADPV